MEDGPYVKSGWKLLFLFLKFCVLLNYFLSSMELNMGDWHTLVKGSRGHAVTYIGSELPHQEGS